MFEPTYVFGYGSLLLADGINGRGMAHKYTDKELIPCELSGYERSMCGFYGGRNFYGLLPKTKGVVNGVIFKVHDWYDYRAFLYSEGGTSQYGRYRTYWPIRITDKLNIKAPKGHRVMTLLCKEDRSGLGRVEKRYIWLCHEGAKKWGPDFEKRFLSTGGVPWDKKRIKKIAQEHSLKLW